MAKLKRRGISILGRLRNYFIAGIVVLVPIGITLYLTRFFISISSKLIPNELNPNSYLPFAIPGLEILLAIIFITIIGSLSLSFIGKKILKIFNDILKRIPILRTIYSAIGQMTETLAPKNRKKIVTYSKLENKISEIIRFVKKEISNKNQIFWVCPLIEESKKVEQQSVVNKFKYLEKYFKNRIGLIHGSLDKDERNKILNNFLDRKLDILVATTVIEVGIDFPNANVIVIENADKYGLSQLHQLRGRVGRGSKQSYCILMFKSSLSENAKKRINILKSSDDGFVISEEDMKLRGYGDLLGFKQSGIKNFRLADPILNEDLLSLAEIEVKKLEMKGDNFSKYNKLLKLYDRASIINEIS